MHAGRTVVPSVGSSPRIHLKCGKTACYNVPSARCQVSGWDYSFVPPTRSSGSGQLSLSAPSGPEDSDCSTSTYRPACPPRIVEMRQLRQLLWPGEVLCRDDHPHSPRSRKIRKERCIGCIACHGRPVRAASPPVFASCSAKHRDIGFGMEVHTRIATCKSQSHTVAWH